MTEQRFVGVAPAAYAALGLVLAELRGETAKALNIQASQAQVIREVPYRMIDLDVPAGSPPGECSDGPLPARAAIVGEGGRFVGELLVWVMSGRLISLEQAWFTDEPPGRWPSGGELVFQ